jgi:hypothetical protein
MALRNMLKKKTKVQVSSVKVLRSKKVAEEK